MNELYFFIVLNYKLIVSKLNENFQIIKHFWMRFDSKKQNLIIQYFQTYT